MKPFFDKKEKHNDNDDDAGSDCSVVLAEGSNFNRNDILICATHGKIYAIHKRNGSRLWRANFPTGAFGGIVSLFVTDYDKLVVGANGKTACMNLFDGATIWVNKMPGFGTDEVSVITTPSRFLEPKKHPINVTEESATFEELPPDYHKVDDNIAEKPIVLGSSRGKIMAMDSETGKTLWTYNCPGGWYNLPVAIVEPPSLEDGRPDQLIYVGAGRRVYCLKAKTGEVIWDVKVSGSIFGLNYMTLATPWCSRLAAEAHSAFSQNPSAQARDWEREQERRSH
ncbi:hypothetical protein BDF20DRAFT_914517 [Mycotypha africana]|uniref:uncharacterized protein n=1 Tax=Mycotypha africana TaxID=64632 RepID=UPI0023004767|nr:uncharacterized protein BDF20DRAFT_914517 [Mycotypha africana]KAI8975625.1 hypothetical protein BDF20DRAFT_914517 [Mycotypha africana]